MTGWQLQLKKGLLQMLVLLQQPLFLSWTA